MTESKPMLIWRGGRGQGTGGLMERGEGGLGGGGEGGPKSCK